MIATGTMPLRPLTLQNPQGTYGTVPPPSGSSSTGINMGAPQFISSSTRQPAIAPRMAPPAPTSPAAPLSPPPAVGGAPRPAAPTNVNPSLAGTSTIAPAPGGFNPATLNVDPSVPRGNNFGPPPAPTPVAGAPGAPAGIVPPGTSAVSGGEVPYHIGTDPHADTTGILSKLATEAGRQLDQPTVYDDAMAKQIKDSQVAGINSNYDVAGQHLDARLADRGINYSTIAGGDIMDLEKQRAGALSGVDAQIAAQRSADLAAGRSAAFNNARGFVDTRQGVDQTTRGNQAGERGYTDQLRNQAQGAAIAGDQSFQQLLNTAYGQGTGSQAGAAGVYGAQGAAASGAQAQDQQGLAELAQLAAQFFGQKAA